MSDIIRVLRVIEYTGPRDKVEDQVSRSLHGEKRLPNGVTIKAATVGTYPEMLENLPVMCLLCNHPPHKGQQCSHIQTDDKQCQCGRVYAHASNTSARRYLLCPGIQVKARKDGFVIFNDGIIMIDDLPPETKP